MFARLPILTPFEVGPVNAYIAGRTLIDPGPDTEAAWSALCDGLEERGLAPADLERVAITHPHPDHFGLAERLRAEGADVLASPTTADVIADFEAHYGYERSYFVDFFERHGMARTTAETVTDLPASFLRVAPGVETDRVVRDGEAFSVAGATVTAEVVEGHAAGETIFTYDAEGGTRAVVGDHVLADITPNPLLRPPDEPGGERPRVLPAYNRSLAALRDRSFDRLLPGHREEIPDPSRRVGEILDAHEDRTDGVRSIVAGGPTTAVEVMHDLFDDLPATEYFPGMSEAVGHLDVLEERGTIEPRDRGGKVVYEVVGA